MDTKAFHWGKDQCTKEKDRRNVLYMVEMANKGNYIYLFDIFTFFHELPLKYTTDCAEE